MVSNQLGQVKKNMLLNFDIQSSEEKPPTKTLPEPTKKIKKVKKYKKYVHMRQNKRTRLLLKTRDRHTN